MLSNATSHGCSSAALPLVRGARLAVPDRWPERVGWEVDVPACGRDGQLFRFRLNRLVALRS